ncbi:hypothetical protein AGOR_G00087360 [Albula goreensis]|uniref:Uncharacterized protein n=1 Tax=Albula goreensis TaxID=1534307 RepID=A0A8T3DUA6_9TELE|nr:hypothetical protein AGOR_G00087360 [Albula goreensis]
MIKAWAHSVSFTLPHSPQVLSDAGGVECTQTHRVAVETVREWNQSIFQPTTPHQTVLGEEAGMGVMAPVKAGVSSLAMGGLLSPEVALISSVIFILLILTLLTLCTDCGRQSFDLNHSTEVETDSTLIRVVKTKDISGTRQNPYINDITNDEKAVTRSIPESLSTVPEPFSSAPSASAQTGNVWFTPWRSHSVIRDQAQGNHSQDLNLNAGVDPLGLSDIASFQTSTGGHIAQAPPPVVVTQWTEASPTLRSAPLEKTPARTIGPTGQANQDGRIPSNPSRSPEWPVSIAPHPYETFSEVGAAAVVTAEEEEPEDPLYNTIDLSAPPLLTLDQQRGGHHSLTLPRFAEGKGEDLSDRDENAVYAQVNRKTKSLSRPQVAPPPPPITYQTKIEEEDPPPPVPMRGIKPDHSFPRLHCGCKEV